MPTILRIILVVTCLLLAAFCAFGFLATFEPLPAGRQLTWRVIYGGVAVLSLVGVLLVTMPGRRAS